MLLQIIQYFSLFKIGILSFVTAFVVAMLLMPILIQVIKRYKLFDIPDLRKEHTQPVPTMGGIAVCIAMVAACLLWTPVSQGFVYRFILFFHCGVICARHFRRPAQHFSTQ